MAAALISLISQRQASESSKEATVSHRLRRLDHGPISQGFSTGYAEWLQSEELLTLKAHAANDRSGRISVYRGNVPLGY